MKGNVLGRKSGHSKDNKTSNSKQDFYAIFKIVKKQLVFMYFLNARKKNEKIDFRYHSEGGAKSVVSSLCNRIRYCEYSNNREGSTSNVFWSKFTENPGALLTSIAPSTELLLGPRRLYESFVGPKKPIRRTAQAVRRRG